MNDFTVLGIDLGAEISITILEYSDVIKINYYDMTISDEAIERLNITDKYDYNYVISKSILDVIEDKKPIMVMIDGNPDDLSEELDSVVKTFFSGLKINYHNVNKQRMYRELLSETSVEILNNIFQRHREASENDSLPISMVLATYGLTQMIENAEILNMCLEE